MRLTVMSQMAKGLNQTESEADIPKQLAINLGVNQQALSNEEQTFQDSDGVSDLYFQ